MSNPSVKRVVTVSSKAAHAEADRGALKAYPQLELARAMASGTEALVYLAANPCDVILCDTEMGDMDARHFLKTAKNNPSLKHVPVVMVTTENAREAVLDAVSMGVAGYILRPYTQETFDRHMATALSLSQFGQLEEEQISDAKKLLASGAYDEAIEEFEEIIAMHDQAQEYYDLGCRYLMREKYGKAIIAFQKALRLNDLYAEAYQGLSEAYKAKGDIDRCQHYLKKAAQVYAEFDRLEKVKEVFIEVLKYNHKATNPFNDLGVKLRKSGDYAGALHAYKQAVNLTPNDENVYFNMAKAYFFMGEKSQALEKSAMALTMAPEFPEAAKLYKHLKGEDWPRSRSLETDSARRSDVVGGQGTLKDI